MMTSSSTTRYIPTQVAEPVFIRSENNNNNSYMQYYTAEGTNMIQPSDNPTLLHQSIGAQPSPLAMINANLPGIFSPSSPERLQYLGGGSQEIVEASMRKRSSSPPPLPEIIATKNPATGVMLGRKSRKSGKTSAEGSSRRRANDENAPVLSSAGDLTEVLRRATDIHRRATELSETIGSLPRSTETRTPASRGCFGLCKAGQYSSADGTDSSKREDAISEYTAQSELKRSPLVLCGNCNRTSASPTVIKLKGKQASDIHQSHAVLLKGGGSTSSSKQHRSSTHRQTRTTRHGRSRSSSPKHTGSSKHRSEVKRTGTTSTFDIQQSTSGRLGSIRESPRTIDLSSCGKVQQQITTQQPSGGFSLDCGGFEELRKTSSVNLESSRAVQTENLILNSFVAKPTSPSPQITSTTTTTTITQQQQQRPPAQVLLPGQFTHPRMIPGGAPFTGHSSVINNLDTSPIRTPISVSGPYSKVFPGQFSSPPLGGRDSMLTAYSPSSTTPIHSTIYQSSTNLQTTAGLQGTTQGAISFVDTAPTGSERVTIDQRTSTIMKEKKHHHHHHHHKKKDSSKFSKSKKENESATTTVLETSSFTVTDSTQFANIRDTDILQEAAFVESCSPLPSHENIYATCGITPTSKSRGITTLSPGAPEVPQLGSCHEDSTALAAAASAVAAAVKVSGLERESSFGSLSKGGDRETASLRNMPRFGSGGSRSLSVKRTTDQDMAYDVGAEEVHMSTALGRSSSSTGGAGGPDLQRSLSAEIGFIESASHSYSKLQAAIPNTESPNLGENTLDTRRSSLLGHTQTAEVRVASEPAPFMRHDHNTVAFGDVVSMYNTRNMDDCHLMQQRRELHHIQEQLAKLQDSIRMSTGMIYKPPSSTTTLTTGHQHLPTLTPVSGQEFAASRGGLYASSRKEGHQWTGGRAEQQQIQQQHFLSGGPMEITSSRVFAEHEVSGGDGMTPPSTTGFYNPNTLFEQRVAVSAPASFRDINNSEFMETQQPSPSTPISAHTAYGGGNLNVCVEEIQKRVEYENEQRMISAKMRMDAQRSAEEARLAAFMRQHNRTGDFGKLPVEDHTRVGSGRFSATVPLMVNGSPPPPRVSYPITQQSHQQTVSTFTEQSSPSGYKGSVYEMERLRSSSQPAPRVADEEYREGAAYVSSPATQWAATAFSTTPTSHLDMGTSPYIQTSALRSVSVEAGGEYRRESTRVLAHEQWGERKEVGRRLICDHVVSVETGEVDLTSRFGASRVQRDEKGEFVLNYVEVPIVEEVVREVKTKEFREKIIEKAVRETVYVDKVVEVPQVQFVDKLVEVDKIEETIKHVAVKKIVDVPHEVIREVKIPKVVEKVEIVHVPGEIIEVPKPYIEERQVPVSKYNNRMQYTVVSQTFVPVISEAPADDPSSYIDVECKMINVIPVPVDVYVPLPYKRNLWFNQMDVTHRVIPSELIPAEQQNALVKALNPDLNLDDALDLFKLLPPGRLSTAGYDGTQVVDLGNLGKLPLAVGAGTSPVNPADDVLVKRSQNLMMMNNSVAPPQMMMRPPQVDLNSPVVNHMFASVTQQHAGGPTGWLQFDNNNAVRAAATGSGAAGVNMFQYAPVVGPNVHTAQRMFEAQLRSGTVTTTTTQVTTNESESRRAESQGPPMVRSSQSGKYRSKSSTTRQSDSLHKDRESSSRNEGGEFSFDRSTQSDKKSNTKQSDESPRPADRMYNADDTSSDSSTSSSDSSLLQKNGTYKEGASSSDDFLARNKKSDGTQNASFEIEKGWQGGDILDTRYSDQITTTNEPIHGKALRLGSLPPSPVVPQENVQTLQPKLEFGSVKLSSIGDNLSSSNNTARAADPIQTTTTLSNNKSVMYATYTPASNRHSPVIPSTVTSGMSLDSPLFEPLKIEPSSSKIQPKVPSSKKHSVPTGNSSERGRNWQDKDRTIPDTVSGPSKSARTHESRHAHRGSNPPKSERRRRDIDLSRDLEAILRVFSTLRNEQKLSDRHHHHRHRHQSRHKRSPSSMGSSDEDALSSCSSVSSRERNRCRNRSRSAHCKLSQRGSQKRSRSARGPSGPKSGELSTRVVGPIVASGGGAVAPAWHRKRYSSSNITSSAMSESGESSCLHNTKNTGWRTNYCRSISSSKSFLSDVAAAPSNSSGWAAKRVSHHHSSRGGEGHTRL